MSQISINSRGYDRLRRGTFPELDLGFGKAAVALGYLTPEQLEGCRREQDRLRERGVAPSIGQLLLKRGDLVLSEFLNVLAAWGAQVPESTEPPAPRSADAAPRFALGRYRIVREIAQGGMGIVYEAQDSILGRRVALKVLKQQDPPSSSALGRFQREATIAARLQHPNIVTIHEFGSAKDSQGRQVYYLAMDYVEGKTFAHALAAGTATREEHLRILEDVGRAVAHAHRKGVIHRDLKPSNVILEASGRVILTDFGVAHAEDLATRLTTSGVAIGTPAYMAPEQARGRSGDIDARTDVYALGAMLYEVLTGRPPFVGDPTPLLLQKILSADPTPPRSIEPSIPPELEVIVLKSMDKDPSRRYATAHEWTRDLARFRRGTPIQARPPGPVARWGRSLARNKFGLGSAAALALIAAAAAFMVQRERRSADEDLRQRTVTALDAALELRRAGRVQEMRRFASETAAACREALERGARAAEAHYRLGRMDRALMNDASAFREQDAALASDPDFAPSLYERAVLTARLHGKRVDDLAEEYWRDEVELKGGAAAPVLSREALARNDARARDLRRRLKTDLEALDAQVGRDPSSIGPGEILCARGLLAWTAGEMSRARQLLVRAVESAPGLEEAYEALAMLEIEGRRYEESIRWATTGLERDAGYLPHAEARAFAGLLRALDLSNRGGNAEAAFAAAAADYAAALKTDRRRETTLLRSGLTHLAWGFQRARVAKDPVPLFREAVREFDEAIDANPLCSKGRLWRGTARVLWGLCVLTVPSWGESKDRDALGLSAAATDDLNEVLRESEASESAWMWRGVASLVRGIARAASFADPAESYRKALSDLGESIARNPARDEPWMWRGIVRKSWAIREFFVGLDPKAAYEAALQDFDEAIRRSPVRTDSWTHRGETRLLWASFAMPVRGGDPLPVLREAIRDFDRSIQLNPTQAQVWIYRGSALEKCGRLRIDRGEGGSDELCAALADYEEAARRDPAAAAGLEKTMEGCRQLLQHP